MTAIQRLDRPAIEAVLWHHGPDLAAGGARRVRAHDTVMDAFDRARRVRPRKPPAVDIRADAEAERRRADEMWQPTVAQVTARCHLLAAELDEYDRLRAAAGLQQRRRNKRDEEGADCA